MSKEKVIEYVMNSPYNTNRAVLEGLLDGMGEDEYTLLFEEEVTTAIEEGEEGAPFPVRKFSYNEYINADTIKITFDGIEYQCDLITMDGANYYGGIDNASGEPDFSEYPFLILSRSNGGNMIANMIATQTSGTHTVKVEASQSSSSSSSNDWSTAKVTFFNKSSTKYYYVKIASVTDSYIEVIEHQIPYGIQTRTTDNTKPGSKTITVPLYKQGYILDVNSLSNTNVSSPQVTGDITFSNNEFIITGDGTITLFGWTTEEHSS